VEKNECLSEYEKKYGWEVSEGMTYSYLSLMRCLTNLRNIIKEGGVVGERREEVEETVNEVCGCEE